MRPGNGASVLEYVRDLHRAFAIPILGVTEYSGLSAEELRAELARSTRSRAMSGWDSTRS
ncbi:MAG TPA: hypothetical protein VF060_21525 [Trebonia sp.]